MSWKEFLRPTKGKIILPTIFFAFVLTVWYFQPFSYEETNIVEDFFYRFLPTSELTEGVVFLLFLPVLLLEFLGMVGVILGLILGVFIFYVIFASIIELYKFVKKKAAGGI